MMTGQQSSRAGWLWMSGLTAVAAVSSLASGSSCSAMGVEGDGGGGDPNSGGATSTSSDTGGAGGTHPPFTETTPTDQCPRPDTPWLPLAVDDPAFLGDSTDNASDDYSSYCGGGAEAGRPDVVYPVEVQNRGTLTITAAPAAPPTVVYVESECGVRTTFGLPPDQLPCLEAAGDQIQLGVVRNQQLFVIVEGVAWSGDFDVTLELTEPICGDGVINPASDIELAEQCDFGTSGGGGAGGAGGGAASNGCDASCRFETPVLNEDQCPGPNIDQLVGDPFSGHTVGFSDNHQAPCAPSNGPDRIYSLALQENDQLHLSVEADFDVVLSIMTDCDESKPAHCQDSPGVSTDESLQFTAPESGTYYIVVDGYDAASWGTFDLTATIQ